MIDFNALRAAHPLPQVGAQLVKLRRSGQEWLGCCPFHADRSPSFTVFDHGRRFHCFGCGAAGDVLDFVQRAYGLDLLGAAERLGAGNLPTPRLPHSPAGMPAEPQQGEPDRTGEALAIWQAAIPAAGTLAEAYLRWRGIDPPYPAALRFLSLPYGKSRPQPCLVCAVRAPDGEVTGIQRVWLADDGLGKAAVPKPKLSLGRVRGGAIRLGEPDAAGAVTVCEGPEDGLSLLAMLGGPVWVAAGASLLPGMQFPRAVRSIVIGADNDAAGLRAAETAARAFAGRGLSVRIIRPLPGHKDFNDELRGAQ